MNYYNLGDELILLKDYKVTIVKNLESECKFIFKKGEKFIIKDIKNEWYRLESDRSVFMFQKEILEEYFSIQYSNINTSKGIKKILNNNGYDMGIMKEPFSVYGEKDCIKIEDRLNRKIKVCGLNGGIIGIKFFNNYDFIIEDAEKLFNELHDAIKFSKYLKENIEDYKVV